MAFAPVSPTPPERFARFGGTVTLDGDLMVIGSPNVEVFDLPYSQTRGRLHFYRFYAGDWTLERIESPGLDDDAIGGTLAMRDNIVASGAQPGIAATYLGVRVYAQTDSGWAEIGRLRSSDGVATTSYPDAIGVSGNRIAVGDKNIENRGAVYVFERTGGSIWTQSAKLFIDGSQWVGEILAFDEDRIVTTGQIGDEAVVFESTPEGLWSYATSLQAEPPYGPLKSVGEIALWGDTVMIQTRDPFGEGDLDAYAVVVFRFDDGSWSQTQVLTPPGGTGFIGGSISLRDTEAVVQGEDVLYRYEYAAGLWQLVETVSDPFVPLLGLGRAAFDGGRLVTGRPGFDDIEQDQGQAIVFTDAAESAPAEAIIQPFGLSFSSLATAIDAAAAGSLIEATPRAFSETIYVDFASKPLSLVSSGSIRQPFSASWLNLGDTEFAAGDGGVVDFMGPVTIASGATVEINAKRLLLGPNASVVAGPGSTLVLNGGLAIATDRDDSDLRGLSVRFVGDIERSLEAAAADLGAVDPPALDDQPLAMDTLRVEAGSLNIVNRSASHLLYTPEAVYANRLVVDAGARLNTRGNRVYAREIIIDGEVDDRSNVALINNPCLEADFNADGVIDGSDLGILLALWGDSAYDLTGDGATDGADLGFLLASWGGCP
jgi:hypothetical protein